MYQQTSEVIRTYLTCRWTWFVIIFGVIFGGSACFQEQFIGTALGVPAMFCITFLVSVVKWQFVHPRARLMPGHNQSHLAVFGLILIAMFIVLPLAVSVIHQINPLGPLAFSLTMGACDLFALLLGHGVFMILAIGVLFSGMAPKMSSIWFAGTPDLIGLHAFLVALSLGMIAFCLRHLAILHEEMEGYQTMPIGGMQLSRVERAEQRKLISNALNKRKLVAWLVDYFLDRRLNSSATGKNHSWSTIGISQLPTWLTTILTGIGFVAYALLLYQTGMLSSGNDGAIPHVALIFAEVMPVALTGMTLMQHRPRIAQEIFRPALRDTYFRRLLLVVAMRAVAVWIGIHACLAVWAYTIDGFPKSEPMATTITYLVLAFALQLPCQAIALWLGKLKSHFLCLISMYPVFGFQVLVLSFWWHHRETWPWSYTAGLAVTLIMLAVPIFRWVKRSWLQTELD